jgi:hypothetical protein
MLTLLLTAFVFCITRQILRADEVTQTVTPDTDLEELTDDFYSEVAELLATPDPIYISRATFDETPYLDPEKVLAIDLSLLLP